jgi:hypothetical protein
VFLASETKNNKNPNRTPLLSDIACGLNQR